MVREHRGIIGDFARKRILKPIAPASLRMVTEYKARSARYRAAKKLAAACAAIDGTRGAQRCDRADFARLWKTLGDYVAVLDDAETDRAEAMMRATLAHQITPEEWQAFLSALRKRHAASRL